MSRQSAHLNFSGGGLYTGCFRGRPSVGESRTPSISQRTIGCLEHLLVQLTDSTSTLLDNMELSQAFNLDADMVVDVTLKDSQRSPKQSPKQVKGFNDDELTARVKEIFQRAMPIGSARKQGLLSSNVGPSRWCNNSSY